MVLGKVLSRLGSLTRQVARRAVNLSLPTGLILTYHRVAEMEVDPWELSVSPEHFREQVHYLSTRTNVWRLTDYVQSLCAGSPPDRAVIITFDDGYVDNLSTAAPILKDAALPATFFIVTGAIGQTSEFWWDELERCILRGNFPPLQLMDEVASITELNLEVPGDEEEAEWTNLCASQEKTKSFRRFLYHKFWEFAASLSPRLRSRFLTRVRKTTNTPASARPTHRTLTREELISLNRISGMELGAHGMTHTPLTSLPIQDRKEEITESRARLERMVGESIDAFSYPNGVLDDDTVMLLEEEGFLAGCSTERGLASFKTRPLRLPRLHVPDVNGEKFKKWLECNFKRMKIN